MSYKDYYPDGAADDPRASYNQSDQEEVDVNVCVSITLSKSTYLTVNDYIATSWEDVEVGDEGEVIHMGGIDYDYSECDFNTAYKQQEFTIPELLQELCNRLNKDIQDNPSSKEVQKWKDMLECAKGWEVDDLCICEDE